MADLAREKVLEWIDNNLTPIDYEGEYIDPDELRDAIDAGELDVGTQEVNLYKVGDKVQIRRGLIVGKEYGGDTFVYSMKAFAGREFVVRCAHSGVYLLGNIGWNWTNEMLEPVPF